MFISFLGNWSDYINQTESALMSEEDRVMNYNDKLVSLVSECANANQVLYQQFNADWASIEDITKALQNNIIICQNSIDRTIEIWDYEGDSSLKDVVVELLNMEIDYLDKFSKTTDYRDSDNITDENKEAYNSVITELNDAENSLNQKFEEIQNVQEIFAEKYWFVLE